ncbi:4'-phosphopantetheinyl transferase superfamily protein [uncultured Tateyamaria sp.]|uniref:4'-phosphopantetheinyl transferase family protein n=1 Tax=uncultured Tateyamaria sp. TaxID=455651 RepID=UPI00261EBEF9|nr:4'-phosphopantetheinyl transferase superfamily protein [uncultured Tateyamaria sp.]
MTGVGAYNTMPLASVTSPQSGEVHVWQVSLSTLRASGDGWTGLSPEEQARYRRFRRDEDAHRFAARRTALRHILSAYLQCDLAEVAYETMDAAGKPVLAQPHQGEVVFNASSSADIALIAVAQEGTIGVDVEYARPFEDMGQIARQYFTVDEVARLEARPPSQRCDAFYRLWTSKEALLKAEGAGLPGGLDRFEVSSDPSRPPELLDDAAGPARFHLYAADPGNGYFGAVATDRPDLSVLHFAFDPGDLR